MNTGPYYVTRDDETGNAYVNDERDPAWAFDCGVCSWADAQDYADQMNADADSQTTTRET
jgi:hypothetical protein